MSRQPRWGWAVGVLALSSPFARSEAPRTDHYGDPLPPLATARLGTVRLRHTSVAGNAGRALFSPDGRSILTTNEQSLRLWDAVTGQFRWQAVAGWSISYVAFAPDGRSLAVVVDDERVLILDAETGRTRKTLLPKVEKEYVRVAFAPDGRTLAVYASFAEKTEVELWDAASGERVGRLEADGPTPFALAFSPDGKSVTACGQTTRRDPASRLRLLRWDRLDGPARQVAVL